MNISVFALLLLIVQSSSCSPYILFFLLLSWSPLIKQLKKPSCKINQTHTDTHFFYSRFRVSFCFFFFFCLFHLHHHCISMSRFSSVHHHHHYHYYVLLLPTSDVFNFNHEFSAISRGIRLQNNCKTFLKILNKFFLMKFLIIFTIFQVKMTNKNFSFHDTGMENFFLRLYAMVQ